MVKRILYSSGGFLTADVIADALMEYASVLAIVGSADVVACPGVDERGRTRRIQLVLGPASQIMAMDTDEPDTELDLADALEDLRRRAHHRLPSAIDVADAGDRAPAESDAESVEHPSAGAGGEG